MPFIIITKPKKTMEIDINKTYTFVVSKRAANSVMPSRLAPASVTIPGEDTILDIPVVDGISRPEMAKQRMIRFSQRENSIFADEQSEDATAEPITIFDGVMQVSGREINKIKYLLLSNYNASKPADERVHSNSLFKEWIAEREADNHIIPQKTRINVKANILNMPFQDLKHYALAITKGQTPISQVYDMGESQLRHYLMQQADNNYSVFDFDTKNAVIQNVVIIKRAINEGLLKYNAATRSLMYANGTVLLDTPIGQDPIDTIAEHAQQNSDYLDVIRDLRSKLNLEDTPIFTKKFTNEIEKVQQKINSTDLISESISKGLQADAIDQMGTSLKFKNKIYKTKGNLRQALESDPNLWLDLQREIHRKLVKK